MLTVNRKSLSKSLSSLCKALPRQFSGPWGESVLLSLTGGSIRVEIRPHGSFRAYCEIDGASSLLAPTETAVDARALLDVVKRSVGDVLDLSVDANGVLSIASQTTTTTLTRSCPIDSFPEPLMVEAASMAYGYLDAADLSWVSRAMGQDETRTQLCGVCLYGRAMVATDGHRLHTAPYPDGCDKDRVLIPANAIKTALSLAGKGRMTVAHDINGHIKLTTDGGCVFTTKASAAFPPVEQVIPKFERAKVVLSIDAICLEVIASLATKSHPGVGIMVNGVVEARSMDPDRNGKAIVPVRDKIWRLPDGAEGEVSTGINARYLSDSVCLGKLCSASLRIDGPLDPWRIDDGERTAIIMPMRV